MWSRSSFRPADLRCTKWPVPHLLQASASFAEAPSEKGFIEASLPPREPSLHRPTSARTCRMRGNEQLTQAHQRPHLLHEGQ